MSKKISIKEYYNGFINFISNKNPKIYEKETPLNNIIKNTTDNKITILSGKSNLINFFKEYNNHFKKRKEDKC